MWRGIVNDRAFVVCPTGIASKSLPGAFTYASHDALSDEIEDAVAALRAKYPDHVDEGPLVYSGFSLGSYQGVRVVSKELLKCQWRSKQTLDQLRDSSFNRDIDALLK